MKYYLETNALRLLSNNLNKYSNCSFTSAYSMFELIANIEKEFTIRKKTVENVFKYLKIDWKLPEQYIKESFKINEFDNNKIHDLKTLCEILINSKNYIDYLEKINQHRMKYKLEYFKRLKQNMSFDFVKNIEYGNSEIKQFVQKGGEYPELELPSNERLNKKEILEFLQKSNKNFNEGITLFAISRNIANAIYKNIEETDDEAEKIYNSYDSGIYYYIEAYSYYCIMKMIDGGPPKKNDLHDLHHLVYLKNNPNLYVVTDDKLLLSFNIQLWSNKNMIIDILEFEKKIKQEHY